MPIRFVMVRDPEEKLREEVFFCTDLQASPVQTLEWAVLHWGLGLFSIVTWLTDQLRPHQELLVQTTAWYPKEQPTFSVG